MQNPQNELIPSQTQIGDYRVIGHVASGGMGDVYEVVNPLLREFFAMKVLREDTSAAPRGEVIQNFLDEARTTVRLRHNNIVTLHTMGLEPQKGRFYFIMDYIGLTPRRRNEVLDGAQWFVTESTGAPHGVTSRVPLSLEDVLQKQGRIDEKVTRILAMDIARALHYAHTFAEGRVVHCDLKPSNVLLREDGHAVIADFGIAQAQRAFGREKADTTSIRGTPDYMAPEQWDVEAELTPAVDVYAYGVMICRLLTGTLPVGMWTPPSKLGLNPGWDVLIERCVQKDPNARWKSMRDIMVWLRHLPAYAQRVKRRQAIRKSFAIAGIVLLLLGIFGALGLVILNMNPRSPDAVHAYRWEAAKVYPQAFVDQDLTKGLPQQTWKGPLVYDARCPETLPVPPEPLPGVDVVVIPKHVTRIPDAFFAQFPRLDTIICERDNPTYFSQDGILYQRGTPVQVVAIPPKCYGTATLPSGVFEVRIPWREVSLTPNRLVTQGAYGEKFMLVAPHPVSWVLPQED